MKKTVALVCAVVFAALTFTACGGGTETTTTAPAVETTSAQGAEYAADYIAEIEVEGYATITAELYGGIAPIAVANFVELARDGFYDGLTFHRIIKGFMIQGGDPQLARGGGSSKSIQGEFALNGIENPLEHTRGTLSMARQGHDYDSATSQFFIVHQNSPHLNGQYAAFGRVTAGMDIVDRICEDTPVVDNNGTVLAQNQPVITAVRIIEV